MGACFNSHTIRAQTRASAFEIACKHQDECRYDMGHGSYTGHLGTAPGAPTVSPVEFNTREQALKHIEGIHRKWDPPILARVKGTDEWVLAGWCSE